MVLGSSPSRPTNPANLPTLAFIHRSIWKNDKLCASYTKRVATGRMLLTRGTKSYECSSNTPRMSDAKHKEQRYAVGRLRRNGSAARSSEGASETPGTSAHPHPENRNSSVSERALTARLSAKLFHEPRPLRRCRTSPFRSAGPPGHRFG